MGPDDEVAVLPPVSGGTDGGQRAVTDRSARQWLDRYAEAVGADRPTDEEIGAVLGLAGIAAHASERTAAPVSAWLAARAGLSPEEAKSAAQALAAALDGAAPDGA